MARRRAGNQVDKEALETLGRAGPKHDRAWEEQQRKRGVVATYRGIPHELQDRVKEIAHKHEVNIGDVARRFLEYAVRAYDVGDLELEAVMVSTTKSLYPEG